MTSKQQIVKEIPCKNTTDLIQSISPSAYSTTRFKIVVSIYYKCKALKTIAGAWSALNHYLEIISINHPSLQALEYTELFRNNNKLNISFLSIKHPSLQALEYIELFRHF
jgi:hypothetical protein